MNRPFRRHGSFRAPFRCQRGAMAVEVAMTFATFIVILVGLVQIVRLLWIWSLLGEATERAARVAALCDVNDPAIYSAASELPGLGLNASNVLVEYVYCVGTDPMSASCDSFQTASLGAGEVLGVEAKAAIQQSAQIFVRVGIRNFSPPFAFLLSLENPQSIGRTDLPPPATQFLERFDTVLPAESLGWNPEGGDGRGAFEVCP